MLFNIVQGAQETGWFGGIKIIIQKPQTLAAIFINQLFYLVLKIIKCGDVHRGIIFKGGYNFDYTISTGKINQIFK